jgi:hypothetical protein
MVTLMELEDEGEADEEGILVRLRIKKKSKASCSDDQSRFEREVK